jgi:hypothetical protein
VDDIAGAPPKAHAATEIGCSVYFDAVVGPLQLANASLSRKRGVR